MSIKKCFTVEKRTYILNGMRKKRFIGAYLPPELAAQFEELAEKKYLTKTQLFREILEKWLTEEGKGEK